MRKYFTGLSINNHLTCCLLEERRIIKGAEGRKFLNQILHVDYMKCWPEIAFCESGNSQSGFLHLAGLCLSKGPWMLEIIWILLRVDLKWIVFLILQSLQLFSWAIVCPFDNNLDLHSFTLENLRKLTHFAIDFLCLFCWSFFIALNTAYYEFWSLMINGLICAINFSMIRTFSCIPHLSSLQYKLKCMHQLNL